MMIKKCLLLSTLVCFLPTYNSTPSTVTPNIRDINSIQEVKDDFQHARQDDLFIFDVDDTILEIADPGRQTRFCNNQELKKCEDALTAFFEKKPEAKEKLNAFLSTRKEKEKVQPIEKTLIDAILDLQKRNVKVIALTAHHTGPHRLIKRIEEWRYKQLLTLGLDFSSSFPQQEVAFDTLQETDYVISSRYKEGSTILPAGFYKGIVCSSLYPKGIVLKSFLEKIGWPPARIFFFDDRSQHVISVAEEMKKIGIECHAFVYKAATWNRPTTDLDLEVARLQYELMKQRDDYVDYFEAKEIVEHQRNNIKVPQAVGQIKERNAKA
ncbi:MAG: DUF2608 domain-containing protein [Candidatus Babeliales bacterium]